ncbi:MAG: electron transfer flavoprotein [Myxococcales bacterium]|nr:electron transfer flavoprotein [Myxococcales bacterium]|tara:strand:- start:1067 stop:3106 length:2040 start_codon:yes stop_codon:yes gene_type:complete
MQSWLVPTILVVSSLAFARNGGRLVRLILLGKNDFTLQGLGDRINDVLVYVLGQLKLLREPGAGILHMAFFYGFLLIQVGLLEFILAGVYKPNGEPFTYAMILGVPAKSTLMLIYWASQELAIWGVGLACAIAIFRRWFLRGILPRLKKRSLDAELIIAFIAVLMISLGGHQAAEMAAGHGTFGVAENGWTQGRPLTAIVAGLYTTAAAETWSPVFWWIHFITIMVFLNYLPFSKHLHLLGAAPNFFFRPRDMGRSLPKIDFEVEEEFGVGRVEQFRASDLLDSFACAECNRCTVVCPANSTGKPLDPAKIVHDMKDNLYANEVNLVAWAQAGRDGAPEVIKPLIAADGSGSVHVDELWSCTTCGACMEECPVGIRHVPKILEMRRHLTMMEGEHPEELGAVFRGLENNANPWGMGANMRFDWAEGLDIPTVETNPDYEYLYYVGCAGSFDDRAKKTTLAMVKLLRHAQINFAVLGKAESCNGETARRLGQEYLFVELAGTLLETFKTYGVKKVITTCPHCLNTFNNDYPDLEGYQPMEIHHHIDFVENLVRTGALTLNDSDAGTVTYHDSCYLARYNGITESPRTLLTQLGANVVEMERNKDRGFCCGAGGGRMWMEEHLGTRVNQDRTKEAQATGAATVAVGCPFCMTMIGDGTRELGVADELEVVDLAEMVADRLP